jgi:hypothetical protein
MQVRIARIFNTYGPRMCIDDGRVVSNFVAQVKETACSWTHALFNTFPLYPLYSPFCQASTV